MSPPGPATTSPPLAGMSPTAATTVPVGRAADVVRDVLARVEVVFEGGLVEETRDDVDSDVVAFEAVVRDTVVLEAVVTDAVVLEAVVAMPETGVVLAALERAAGLAPDVPAPLGATAPPLPAGTLAVDAPVSGAAAGEAEHPAHTARNAAPEAESITRRVSGRPSSPLTEPGVEPAS